MSNEYTMENINRLAIGNLARMCEDIEDRIAYLEKMHNQTYTASTDGLAGSTVSANGFDLVRYRELLEICIASRKQAAKDTDSVKHYERCNIKIEAYEHALKLLDA